MIPEFQYVRDPVEVERLAKKLLAEPYLAFDTETTGLDAHTDKVILASISTKDQTYVIDTRDQRCLEALREPLEKEALPKLGFYLFFDYCMTKGTAGIDLEGAWDLHLAEKLLGAGIQWDGFSLEAVTRKYLDKERDKSLQKSFINFKGEFSQEQLQYAAEDTADLIPLAVKMKEAIQKEGLSKIWGIENRAMPAFADIYYYGLKIDIPAWQKIMEANWKKMKEAENHLGTFFDPFFGRQETWNFETGKVESELTINFASQPTILYGLQRMGIKVDGQLIQDTNDQTRKKISDKPVIQSLDAYREAQKAYGTYGQPYLDAIHPKTGRIHPKMDQLGTDTGRSTCPKPNVANVPRGEQYRHAFITDEGRLISTVDFSGAELRILADQSGDPLMIKGFRSGVDFHCFVAAMLFNKEKVEKKDPVRTPTKTLNFGLAYGMGPNKLYAQLGDPDLIKSMGYRITLEECKDLFKKYKITFKDAVQWLDDNKRIARRDLVMVNIAGRRRRWTKPNYHKAVEVLKAEFSKKRRGVPLTTEELYKIDSLAREKIDIQWASIEREGANFVVQSTNVEMLKESMYEIRKACKKRNYDARFYNSVYDETVLDVAQQDALEVHELQKKIMIECGAKYCAKVPVLVDGHLEKFWTK